MAERVRMVDMDIAIEGSFRTSPVRPSFSRRPRSSSRLSCVPGSIKGMERIFGISYPTIKSRPTCLANAPEFVETNPCPSKSEILERPRGRDITAEAAIREMEALQ